MATIPSKDEQEDDDASESGEEDDDGDAATSKSTIAKKLAMLPVIIIKVLVCKFCLTRCTDPRSVPADPKVTTGGYEQWNIYREDADHPGYKKPYGRQCATCVNLWRMLELKIKFKKPQAYTVISNVAADFIDRFSNSLGFDAEQ